MLAPDPQSPAQTRPKPTRPERASLRAFQRPRPVRVELVEPSPRPNKETALANDLVGKLVVDVAVRTARGGSAREAATSSEARRATPRGVVRAARRVGCAVLRRCPPARCPPARCPPARCPPARCPRTRRPRQRGGRPVGSGAPGAPPGGAPPPARGRPTRFAAEPGPPPPRAPGSASGKPGRCRVRTEADGQRLREPPVGLSDERQKSVAVRVRPRGSLRLPLGPGLDGRRLRPGPMHRVGPRPRVSDAGRDLRRRRRGDGGGGI